MLCQKCHRNLAVIEYAEVIKGHVSEIHVCQTCYASMDIDNATGFGIAGEAPSPQNAAFFDRVGLDDPSLARRLCRVCGKPLSEIFASKSAGCPGCYAAFHEELGNVLAFMHGSALHRGRNPGKDGRREHLRADLQNKRALLRAALEVENYEEAARLRDTIRELAGGMRTAVEPAVKSLSGA